ncbi:MAG: ATP-binding cassette domain-containing protein [Oscillospiraceae bacterium]
MPPYPAGTDGWYEEGDHGEHTGSRKSDNSYYEEGRSLIGGRSKRRQVLHNVSFTVNSGETVGLVGESGSGKTTLCRAVLGLIKRL